jgi:hypothetical protein
MGKAIDVKTQRHWPAVLAYVRMSPSNWIPSNERVSFPMADFLDAAIVEHAPWQDLA